MNAISYNEKFTIRIQRIIQKILTFFTFYIMIKKLKIILQFDKINGQKAKIFTKL